MAIKFFLANFIELNYLLLEPIAEFKGIIDARTTVLDSQVRRERGIKSTS